MLPQRAKLAPLVAAILTLLPLAVAIIAGLTVQLPLVLVALPVLFNLLLPRMGAATNP